VTHHVEDGFDQSGPYAGIGSGGISTCLQWAPIRVVEDPHQPGNKCLELRDEDPYDYALAERAFPESLHLRVEFRIPGGPGWSRRARSGDPGSLRPSSLETAPGRQVAGAGSDDAVDPPCARAFAGMVAGAIGTGCTAGNYDLFLNGKEAVSKVRFRRKGGDGRAHCLSHRSLAGRRTAPSSWTANTPRSDTRRKTWRVQISEWR